MQTITRLAAVAALAMPLGLMAETPNVEPGEWEFTTTINMEGGQAMPEQSHTDRECLTESDIESVEDTLLSSVGECQVMSTDITSEGMDFQMTCDLEGQVAEVGGEYTFDGDSMTGKMRLDMMAPAAAEVQPGEDPNGGMQIFTDISGERIGDC
ncbi:DUF3617 domain-containing protein [Methylonatrum kenyense]|uniref:DUF3617 domain-containing protein n=1 Tax=Methylonatrum kenyense TaxID=455253 RepID=UPI0020BFD9CD|nr:DUF3617 family protein [Methylonatrum kenyense]MCK8516432.1 DUF3617 domain-containing protein [Methylonatrum kenyense]